MRTLTMDKDFDFHVDAQTNVSYQAGRTYERVPEAQAEAIVKAGAGRVVKDAPPAKPDKGEK